MPDHSVWTTVAETRMSRLQSWSKVECRSGNDSLTHERKAVSGHRAGIRRNRSVAENVRTQQGG
jgi:hypothetical protein